MPYVNFYSQGTISVANGSTSVTGQLTGWDINQVQGGMLVADGRSVMAVIESVEGETALTLDAPWEGTSLVEEPYFILLVSAAAADAIQSSRMLADLIARLNAGTYADIFAGVGFGTLAERDNYDEQPKGFAFLKTDAVPFVLYVKESDANGDWSPGNPYGQGEPGESAGLDEILAAATPHAGVDAATLAVNIDDGAKLFHAFTIGGNRTLGVPTNVPNDGTTFYVEIKQDGTGGHTLAFASGYETSRGIPIDIATGAGMETMLSIVVRTVSPFRAYVFKTGQQFA